MKKLFKIFLYILIILYLLLNCIRENIEEKTQYIIFFEQYAQAISPFADKNQISATILLIDDIIEKEGNKNILIIHYYKAQLYYKNKQYDEALEVLFQADDEVYNAYIATLLLRLGRYTEADYFLTNAISNNVIALKDINITNNSKNEIIKGLMILYILNGESYDNMMHKLSYDDIISIEKADELFQETFFNQNIENIKEILLDSMWP